MPFPFMAAATLGAAALSAYGQRSANKANRESSREQMAFQESQSSSAVQRQMRDMKAAGINPILAGKYGGASSPGGASYDAGNVLSDIPTAVSSAIQLKRLKAELENMSVTNDNLRANTQQIRSQTALNNVSAKKVASDILMSQADRARALALQPAYNAAGGIISGGISSAKRAGDIVLDVIRSKADKSRAVAQSRKDYAKRGFEIFGRGK
ncbi:MAG: minor capsid protein [Microviridae sp.]